MIICGAAVIVLGATVKTAIILLGLWKEDFETSRLHCTLFTVLGDTKVFFACAHMLGLTLSNWLSEGADWWRSRPGSDMHNIRAAIIVGGWAGKMVYDLQSMLWKWSLKDVIFYVKDGVCGKDLV